MKLLNSVILPISSCNDLFIQDNNLETKPRRITKKKRPLLAGKVYLEQQSKIICWNCADQNDTTKTLLFCGHFNFSKNQTQTAVTTNKHDETTHVAKK